MKIFQYPTFCLMFIFLVACGGSDEEVPTPQPDPDPDPVEDPEDLGTWTNAAAMPTSRKEIANATVVHDGKIYVFGGVASNATMTDKLEIYDIASDSWSTGSVLPFPVWRTCAAAVNGKIYVFGGYTSLTSFPFNPSNRVLEYNTTDDSWTEKQTMPVQRGAAVALTLDNKIHLIGGANNQALNRHDIYDPATDTWTAAAGMSTTRSGLTGAVSGNSIYVMGGYELGNSGVIAKRSVEVFNGGSWSSGVDMPISRLGIDAATFNGRILVFGGVPGTGVSLTLTFDPQANTWSTLQEMPIQVSFMGVAPGDDAIYVIGGGPVNLNRTDGVNRNRKFTPPQ